MNRPLPLRPNPAAYLLLLVVGSSFLSGLGFAQTTAKPAPNPTPDLLHSWHQWRGPLGNGVAPHARPPVQWSESQHLGWKITLPGKGHSSPVVHGDRLFLTSAQPVGEARKPVYDRAPGTHDNLPVTHRHQFLATAVERSTGRVLWSTPLRETFPHEGGHQTGSLASQSPTTDGTRLYVSLGSHGVYCLDRDGTVLWQQDLGRMNTLHAHGEGSSPVLCGDLLILNWDHEGTSFLVAFDKLTGEQRWKTPRDEKTSWSTPLVVVHGGSTQIVVSATQRIRGYEPESDTEIWACAGLTDNVVSSPVQAGDLIVAGNSYYTQSMVALRFPGARGDITDSPRVVWKLRRLTPYVSSPLLYGDTLYFLRHNQNILSRLDPESGRPRGEPIRLEGINDFLFASPVGAAGRIYLTARDGTTVVLNHDRTNAVLAVNRLDDSFSATPALVDGEIFLRGEKYLYCIRQR